MISPKGNLVAISKLCLAKLRVRMKLSLQSPSSSQEHGALKAGRTGLAGEGVWQGVQAAEKWFWAQQFFLVCILLWNISFCLFISPPPFFSLLPSPLLPPSPPLSLSPLALSSIKTQGFVHVRHNALPLSYIPILFFKNFILHLFIYLFGGGHCRCQRTT